jgi:hypothetical protein
MMTSKTGRGERTTERINLGYPKTWLGDEKR